MMRKRITISAALGILYALVMVSFSGCASRSAHGMMHSVDSEYDFLVEMIPHHQEAVDSAGEIAASTSRPELRAFVQEIAFAQSAEIIAMKSWLAEWYPGKSDKAVYKPMMRPTAGFSPDRADRAFLEDMIMHHRMAVMMADQIIRRRLSERPEVLKLAHDIIRSQNAEIELMETWLFEWYGIKSGGRHH